MVTPNDSTPRRTWEEAGRQGYFAFMYASPKIGDRISRQICSLSLKAAMNLGLRPQHRVLELGCGDGSFALSALRPNFAHVEAHDVSSAAIERAQRAALPHIDFRCSDITALEFPPGQRWDGVFLIGILHHIKSRTPKLVAKLATITSRVIVIEPNGNHPGRRFLELLPSYRAAGEDSFRRKELEEIFETHGFRETFYQRFNLFPNRTPQALYRLVSRIEPWVERSSCLRVLCTAQVMGFLGSHEGT